MKQELKKLNNRDFYLSVILFNITMVFLMAIVIYILMLLMYGNRNTSEVFSDTLLYVFLASFVLNTILFSVLWRSSVMMIKEFDRERFINDIQVISQSSKEFGVKVDTPIVSGNFIHIKHKDFWFKSFDFSKITLQLLPDKIIIVGPQVIMKRLKKALERKNYELNFLNT